LFLWLAFYLCRRKISKLSKEERDKHREEVVKTRKAILTRMGTPRSHVLAQLVQQEAQKQIAAVLLPKNVSCGLPFWCSCRSHHKYYYGLGSLNHDTLLGPF